MATVTTLISGGGEEVEFIIKVPRQDIIDLDIQPDLLAAEFRHIFEPRVPFKKEIEDGVKDFFLIEDDINKMYVDHLVINLEKRSIFEIVMFLSRYCGWNRIKTQIDQFIEMQVGGPNAN